MGILSFIPRFRLEKKGILKGYSLDFDVEDLINQATSPCRILFAKRMNRRITDPATQEFKWIPSETVLVTFEGSTLPEYIQLYGLLQKPISPYIEPVKTCKNCFRYGHVSKFCRSLKACPNCGQPIGENIHHCQSTQSRCLHCKEDHPTFHSSCFKMRINKEVNSITAHSDMSITEAFTLAKANLGSSNNNITNKNTIPVTSNKEFPKLPPIAPIKTLELRQIGGINRDSANVTNQWLNNNHKTYSRIPANIIKRSVSSDSISMPGPSCSTLSNITPKPPLAIKSSSISKQTDSSLNKKPDTTCTTFLIKSYPSRSPRNLHSN